MENIRRILEALVFNQMQKLLVEIFEIAEKSEMKSDEAKTEDERLHYAGPLSTVLLVPGCGEM